MILCSHIHTVVGLLELLFYSSGMRQKKIVSENSTEDFFGKKKKHMVQPYPLCCCASKGFTFDKRQKQIFSEKMLAKDRIKFFSHGILWSRHSFVYRFQERRVVYIVSNLEEESYLQYNYICFFSGQFFYGRTHKTNRSNGLHVWYLYSKYGRYQSGWICRYCQLVVVYV